MFGTKRIDLNKLASVPTRGHSGEIIGQTILESWHDKGVLEAARTEAQFHYRNLRAEGYPLPNIPWEGSCQVWLEAAMQECEALWDGPAPATGWRLGPGSANKAKSVQADDFILTGEQVAAELGVSSGTVSRWANNPSTCPHNLHHNDRDGRGRRWSKSDVQRAKRLTQTDPTEDEITERAAQLRSRKLRN